MKSVCRLHSLASVTSKDTERYDWDAYEYRSKIYLKLRPLLWIPLHPIRQTMYQVFPGSCQGPFIWSKTQPTKGYLERHDVAPSLIRCPWGHPTFNEFVNGYRSLEFIERHRNHGSGVVIPFEIMDAGRIDPLTIDGQR